MSTDDENMYGDGDGQGGSPPSIVVVLLVILRVGLRLGQRNVENFSEKIRIIRERRFGHMQGVL
ncbi:hypothetical protein PanWU01x14_363430 [Parasponia andersonii]|uniref:Transmembrane protein n=1 Tax=Parasponia andersonii TaxID=3476 RepID=A0A2P5A6M8_PARAD|nr:hypothetical protein PanWU01x14_363430 [Parasponia andersonii]